MRAVPAGIALRVAGPADPGRVQAMVRGELEHYREWAPDWVLPEPTPEVRARLDAAFADPDIAWVLMAEAGEEVVGVVSLSLTTAARAERPVPGTVYLWQMFVRRDWQGSGLAGVLMDRVIEESRSRGFTRMVLWTPAGAAQARRFYEREGWTTTGGGDEDSDFGLPLIEYEREIDRPPIRDGTNHRE